MRHNAWFPIAERWDGAFIRKLVLFAALTGGFVEGAVSIAWFGELNFVVAGLAGISVMLGWFFVFFSGVRLYQHVRRVNS
jgi:hypothetical protein